MANYSRQSHAVYYIRYHLVFSTRYRRKVLKHGMGTFVCVVMRAIERRHPEIVVHEANTDVDHLHLLVSVAPKMAISTAVRILKTVTSRAMRRKFPFLKQAYWGEERGIWSVGYFISTVGVNEKTIRNYIEYQGKEDSGRATLELV